ncbi:amidase [Actinocrispum wychmicini]|uniref:Amidase n=1 Tax=Actinocrispum wychmicini TaxID=1213861 RepID=A0A4V2S654_9PSEU|nr:amidase [Actinocrispum wychmicini]TCO54740.1 amidase [Actinocrispum wychmicini]
MADIVHLDALELSALIKTGQVSCVEVMRAYLDHIDRVNPQVNAIVGMLDRAELDRQARQRDQQLADGQYLGWMHGFPLAVKDLVSVAGLLWTQGSPLFADRIGEQDDLIARRMRAAGAIMVGKTNSPEFGLGSQTYNPVFGTTLNPYDPTRTAGGSSGGTAAALALRMLPVADGSDYGGSLRNPAAFTNVLGFRPSWGRVPRADFLPQLGTAGPMGRTVADVAALLEVLAGPDPSVPLSLDADPAVFRPPLPARDFTGTRIAWVGDFDGHLATEPGVLDLCRTTFSAFESVGCVVEEALPAFPMDRVWHAFQVWRWWNTLWMRELYDDEATRGALKPELVWEIERGIELTVADISAAVDTRLAWYQALEAMFERYDFILAPSAQVFPFDAKVPWPSEVDGRPMDTYHRWMETVAPWSLAGVPVMGMPAGFDPRGLPMGVQLVGRPRDDLGVLQLAQAYEQCTQWVRDHPPAMLTAERSAPMG